MANTAEQHFTRGIEDAKFADDLEAAKNQLELVRSILEGKIKRAITYH